MKKRVAWIAIFPMAAFAVAGLLSSCVSLNGLVSQPNVETEKASIFQLSGLSISPAQVAVLDVVVITAEVTNITSANENYNAELKINNATAASDKVLVPAGKKQTLTFAIFKDKPGTYRVTLGQLAGQFTVVESVAVVGQGSQVPTLSGAAGCCSTGTQNKLTVPSQSRRTSGCGCCR